MISKLNFCSSLLRVDGKDRVRQRVELRNCFGETLCVSWLGVIRCLDISPIRHNVPQRKLDC